MAALLAAVHLPAQTNLERVVNGGFTPSHDYDLIHQRIEVRNFNWDSTSFDGRVTTTLVSLRAGLDSIILDMGRSLTVRSVTPARSYARPGDTLVVRLARPAAFGDTVRFTVDYDARITNGRGLTFIDERPHTPRQIWSQGEDMDNHFWFPTYDFPNDKTTWDLNPRGTVAFRSHVVLSFGKSYVGNQKWLSMSSP